MEKPFTIIGIGEILWDEFPHEKRLGGAPANVAFHANALGARGIIISRIGNDADGRGIRELLDKENIPHYLTVDPDHPTGRVTVRTDSDGTADYTIHEGAAWDYMTIDLPMIPVFSNADAICFGTLAQRNPVSGKAIRQAIRATRSECIRLFDMNLRQHYYSETVILEMLELATILKLNHEEFDIITNMLLRNRSETQRLEELIDRFGLTMIILTKGKNGSRIFMDKNLDSVYKSEPGIIVDTVGAGDCFSAAVALGILKGWKLDDIHQMASKAASFVCSQKGATPVLPKEIIHPLN